MVRQRLPWLVTSSPAASSDSNGGMELGEVKSPEKTGATLMWTKNPGPTTPAVGVVPQKDNPDEWQTFVDEKSGRSYRHHSSSGTTEWVDEDLTTASPTLAVGSVPQKDNSDEWETFVDESTGRKYRHHASSGRTEWVDEE